MKDIRSALRATLLADSGISAAIGAARIYPSTLPQGITDPCIVYSLISEVSDYHMQGPSGLVTDRFQIDCWARTVDAAVSLANLVKDRLSGFSGVVAFGSDSPQQEITIRAVFHDQGRDDYDAVAKLYRRQRDYLIWYADR